MTMVGGCSIHLFLSREIHLSSGTLFRNYPMPWFTRSSVAKWQKSDFSRDRSGTLASSRFQSAFQNASFTLVILVAFAAFVTFAACTCVVCIEMQLDLLICDVLTRLDDMVGIG